MAEQDEAALEERNRKLKLPPEAKESPVYQAARGKKIGGILGLSLGGASVAIGLVWLAASSIRILSSTPVDTGGQIGSGFLMGLGTVSMVAGGAMLSIGKAETKAFENEYFLRTVPDFTVDVGAGSVMLSGSF